MSVNDFFFFALYALRLGGNCDVLFQRVILYQVMSYLYRGNKLRVTS
jgi:hypothetical protein